MHIDNVCVELCGIKETVLNTQDGVCHIKTLPNFSVAQSVTGGFNLQINGGREYTTQRGGIFVAPPQANQKITCCMDTDGKMNARWVFLNVTLNSRSAELVCNIPAIPSDKSVSALNGLLNSLFASNDYCEKMSLCYLIVKELLANATPKNVTYNENILSVLEYIKQNYHTKITVDTLASYANMSASNLYASFKKHFGVSPIAYLNDYRLVMASKRLNNLTCSVSEVSQSVGIDDVRYFSKIFKRKFNSTPSDYRKSIVV